MCSWCNWPELSHRQLFISLQYPLPYHEQPIQDFASRDYRLVPSSPSDSTFAASHETPTAALSSDTKFPTTVNVDASPSYSLYSDPPSDIPIALGRSWYVNVPGFERPLVSFTADVEEDHATLDSAPAVLSLALGLAPDARYSICGYSGGGMASEWAAELQVHYAPELNFSGAALVV